MQSLLLETCCKDRQVLLLYPFKSFTKEGGIIISIYQRMKNEHRQLCQQLDEIQTELARLPEGRLICTHNGSRFKWYHSEGKAKTCIPKQNRALAEQLAVKKYLSLQAQNMLQERRSIEYYLRHHDAGIKQADELLTASEYQELLAPYFTPISQELSAWMHAPYERNQKYPEQLIHKASSSSTSPMESYPPST